MGFLSNLFGGGEKKPSQSESEMQSSNPTADLEKIRAENQAKASTDQTDRLTNQVKSATESGVVTDKYGQNPADKPAIPTTEAPEVSPSPENSTTTPNQAANTPEQSDDQKAA